MSLKVIGAGFGRTGTHSLKIALEMLGFAPCYHMVEVFTHAAIRKPGKRPRVAARSTGMRWWALTRPLSTGLRAFSGASF